MDWGWDSDAFDAVKSLSPAAMSKTGGSSWKSSLVGESCVTVLERLWLVATDAIDTVSLGGGSCVSPSPASLSPAEAGSSACSARSWSFELAICCSKRASRRKS